jgi:hypothetical protein
MIRRRLRSWGLAIGTAALFLLALLGLPYLITGGERKSAEPVRSAIDPQQLVEGALVAVSGDLEGTYELNFHESSIDEGNRRAHIVFNHDLEYMTVSGTFDGDGMSREDLSVFFTLEGTQFLATEGECSATVLELHDQQFDPFHHYRDPAGVIITPVRGTVACEDLTADGLTIDVEAGFAASHPPHGS